ncbi:hypothetical protein JL722_1483 [Aureococcus anophagefferens]|nr:hypothetical protein JL722_1483 [Aureococcus anophagefferens]
MITCALLSRCSGSLSLITTSWALAGFWARKGVCPWWTVVVPLKNFCPRATVASAHASLNQSCSVVELFQALVLCFYQLQAAAVVVGRSAAESSNGGCEAQAALFQLASLGAVVAHGVGLQRAVLRLVVFGEPSSGIQRRFRRYATLGSGAAAASAAGAAGARSALTPLGGFCFAMLAATSDGLWDRLCCVPKSCLESFADEGLEEDEEKKVWCATANCAEAPTVAALLGARDDAEVAEKLRALLPRGYDVYALAVQECLCWAELVARSRRVLCDGGEAYECVGKGAIGSALTGVGFHGFIGLAVFAKASDVRRGAARVGGGAAPAPVVDGAPPAAAPPEAAPTIAMPAPPQAEKPGGAGRRGGVRRRRRRAHPQGAAGLPNKGAVAALVTFHDATLLFVGCHLPADGKAGAKLKKRHAAVRDALARAAEGLGVRGPAATCDAHLGAATHTFFPVWKSTSGMDASSKTSNLSISVKSKFFLGDLNYRAPTARPRDTLDKVARACAADADAHDDPAAATDADAEDARALWDDALADDELRRERAAGRVFAGFSEPAIDFPPTYRYVAGARAAASEGYAHAPLLAAARDLSRSAPLRRDDLDCVSYASLDAVEGSDHRAVGAGFSLRTDAARRDLFRGSIDPGRHAAAPDLELDVSRLARASMVFPLPWEDPDVADRHLAGLAEALDAAGAPAIDVARAPWADRGVAVTADDVRRCLARHCLLRLETADAETSAGSEADGAAYALVPLVPGPFEVRLTRGSSDLGCVLEGVLRLDWSELAPKPSESTPGKRRSALARLSEFLFVDTWRESSLAARPSRGRASTAPGRPRLPRAPRASRARSAGAGDVENPVRSEGTCEL